MSRHRHNRGGAGVAPLFSGGLLARMLARQLRLTGNASRPGRRHAGSQASRSERQEPHEGRACRQNGACRSQIVTSLSHATTASLTEFTGDALSRQLKRIEPGVILLKNRSPVAGRARAAALGQMVRSDDRSQIAISEMAARRRSARRMECPTRQVTCLTTGQRTTRGTGEITTSGCRATARSTGGRQSSHRTGWPDHKMLLTVLRMGDAQPRSTFARAHESAVPDWQKGW